MTNLPQHYTNEHTKISYTLASGDNYYLPNLTLPEEPKFNIGRFGIMRRYYLKNYRKGLFTSLLTTGKLNKHLYEIDQAANSRFELMCKQMAERESVTERLKSDNWLLWIQKMNCIRNQVQEIIQDELIYC